MGLSLAGELGGTADWLLCGACSVLLPLGWDWELLLVTSRLSALTTAGFPPACVSLNTPLHGVPLRHMQNSDDNLAVFVQCRKDSHVVSLSSVVAVVLSDNWHSGMPVEVDAGVVSQTAALNLLKTPPLVLALALVHSVFVLPHLYF